MTLTLVPKTLADLCNFYLPDYKQGTGTKTAKLIEEKLIPATGDMELGKLLENDQDTFMQMWNLVRKIADEAGANVFEMHILRFIATAWWYAHWKELLPEPPRRIR